MKRYTIILTIFALFGLTANSEAQEYGEAIPDEYIQRYIELTYPDVDTILWMHEPNTDKIRAEFESEGEKHYVIVNEEGVKYESGELMSEMELPAVVWDSFRESQYGEWAVYGIYDTSTPMNSHLYRFDLEDEDGELATVYYNNLGEFVNVPHNPNHPDREAEEPQTE